MKMVAFDNMEKAWSRVSVDSLSLSAIFDKT